MSKLLGHKEKRHFSAAATKERGTEGKRRVPQSSPSQLNLQRKRVFHSEHIDLPRGQESCRVPPDTRRLEHMFINNGRSAPLCIG